MAFLLVNVEQVSRSLCSLCCQRSSSVLPSGAKLSLEGKKTTSSSLGLNLRRLCTSHRLPVMAPALGVTRHVVTAVLMVAAA